MTMILSAGTDAAAQTLTPRQPLPTWGTEDISKFSPTAAVQTPQWNPAVATDGTNFVLTWMDGRKLNQRSNPYAVRILADGTELDPHGISIGSFSPAFRIGNTPEFHWNGFSYSYFAEVGKPLIDFSFTGAATPKEDVHQFPVTAGLLRLVFNGKQYLAAWTDGRTDPGFGDAFGRFLAPDGSPVSAQFKICTEPGYQWMAGVATDGESFQAVWTDGRDGTYRVYHARIGADGRIDPPSGKKVFQDDFWYHSRFESTIAFSGGRYAVISFFPDSSMGWAQFDSKGTALGTGKLLAGGNPLKGTQMKLAPAADGFWLAWSQDGTTYLSRLGLDMTVIDWPPLILSHKDGTNLGIAATSENCLAAWSYENNTRVAAALIQLKNGRPVARPMQSTERAVSWAGRPKAAFNGREYLCVWETPAGPNATGYDILGMRLDRDGHPMDPAPFNICAAQGDQREVEVSSLGGDFFVVWTDHRPVPDTGFPNPNGNIYGTLVKSAGPPVSSNGFALSPTSFFQKSPSMATDGSQYFVIWEDGRRELSTGRRIYGMRLDAQLRSITPGAVSVGPVGMVGRPILAGGSNGFFVVIAGTGTVLQGLRLNSVGAAIGTFRDLDRVQTNHLQVAANNHGFLVISRNLAPRFSDPAPGYTGYFLSHAGELTGPFSSPNVQSIRTLALASSGNDFLMVFRDFAENINGLRFTARGGRDDIVPFKVDIDPGEDIVGNPALAYDPGLNRYLLVREKFFTDHLGIAASLHLRFVPLEVVDNRFQLTWVAEPGQRFEVQSSTNLNDNSWLPVGTPLVTTNYTGSFSIPISRFRREQYFRVLKQ